MAKRTNPFVCDCGKPYTPRAGKDTRIKCRVCVKITTSREVKERCVAYLGGKCIDCEFVGPAVAYDFDHRDPEQKSFKISGCYMFRWKELRKELDKCSLRCCRCHRIRHYLEEFGDVV